MTEQRETWQQERERLYRWHDEDLHKLAELHATNQPCNDEVIEENVKLLRSRSRLGEEKYGTTLAQNPAEIMEQLNHIREELLDGANYCTWLMRRITRDEAGERGG